MRIKRSLHFLKHILFAGFRRSVHAFYLRFLPWSRNTDGKTFYSKPSLLRSVWVSLLHRMPVFHYQAKCRYFTKKTFDLTRFDLWHWNSSKCTSTYISHLFCNYFPFILKGFPRLTLHRQNWTSSELVTSLATPAVLTVLGYIKGALLEAWTTEGQATASFQKASFGLTSFS